MKKELFYIKGVKGRGEEVLETLEELGATSNIDLNVFDNPSVLFFVLGGEVKYLPYIGDSLYDLFKEYGNEIHLAKPMKLDYPSNEVVFNETTKRLYLVVDNTESLTDRIEEAVTLDALQEITHRKDVLRKATTEEIKSWNEETLHDKHFHYSLDRHALTYWFHRSEKVIARKSAASKWRVDVFHHYGLTENDFHTVIVGACQECLPYNSMTKKLIGTYTSKPE